MTTIIERVFDAMSTDAEDLEEQSLRLKSAYLSHDDKGREAIDRAFIALCGYSLDTIINLK